MWSVSYVGDGNNQGAVDQGGTAEQTVVSRATPPTPPNIPLSLFLQAARQPTFVPYSLNSPIDWVPPLVGQVSWFFTTPLPTAYYMGSGPEEQLGAISGHVFEDENLNGVLDPGERGLPNEQVVLELEGDKASYEAVATAWTDSKGWYIFMGLKPGLYRVRARLSPEWTQTTKADYEGRYVLTIRGGFHAMSRDFGAYPNSVAPDLPPRPRTMSTPNAGREDAVALAKSAGIGMALPPMPAGEEADTRAFMSIAAHSLTDTEEPRDILFDAWVHGARVTTWAPADSLHVEPVWAEDEAWSALVLVGAMAGIGFAAMRSETEEDWKPELDRTTYNGT